MLCRADDTRIKQRGHAADFIFLCYSLLSAKPNFHVGVDTISCLFTFLSLSWRNKKKSVTIIIKPLINVTKDYYITSAPRR